MINYSFRFFEKAFIILLSSSIKNIISLNKISLEMNSNSFAIINWVSISFNEPLAIFKK
ncbi:hypothetical protein FLAT13_01561 [Flavobacterium salmonis]|uniref:Uncharacterized protein n=1 Tax=Flavobacterium salmonis TaxID=2654844 RepID=A0A6V6YUL1_9FLAO|nr:hypothetical protein FLAT13_01561 [Flavobacterium salmonis]